MKCIPIMLLAILASIGTSLAQGPQSWYSLATSRTGDTVRLNDLEPHTWSYYTAASPIHGLNPADVTITYYGNGTATMTSSSNDDNDPTSFTENVTTVQVGIDAAEHTFVYHKTLERENADGSGHCPYTTIANPFSVRPTGTGSGNAKYRGFYKWRIKSVSGGAIKSADGATTYTAYSGSGATAATNMLDADQSYHFVPNAPYGMTVELEALWAQAYVYTGSGTSPFVAGGARAQLLRGGRRLYYRASHRRGTLHLLVVLPQRHHQWYHHCHVERPGNAACQLYGRQRLQNRIHQAAQLRR